MPGAVIHNQSSEYLLLAAIIVVKTKKIAYHQERMWVTMADSSVAAIRFRFGDVAVAVAVILVVVMMIIPIPTGLLSFFLIFNITLALIVLLISLLIQETLEFSVFPTLLLIMTLFRLSLNISTTRQILLNAYAGEVVQRFGDMVIGGNPVVGFIIFLILVVIQFIVITKGAERISEHRCRPQRRDHH
jgi:flagellar biosynthesis protein FlhA